MALLDKKVGHLLPQEIELIKEAAAALARCGEELERALCQLRQAEVVLEEPVAHGTRSAEAREHYRRAWEKAEKAHTTYIIQREAIGLRNHRFVQRIYPLPTKRRIKE